MDPIAWPAAFAIVGVTATICFSVAIPLTAYFIKGIVRMVVEVKQEVNDQRFRSLEADFLEIKTEHGKLRDEIRGDFRRVFEKLDKIARRSGCEE